MKVAELYDEMGTSDSHLAHLQQADNEDYDVVVKMYVHEQGASGYEDVPVESVQWDHQNKRMVIEL